jgi:GT2 family glycosyltransferase
MIRPSGKFSKDLPRTLRSLKRQTYPHWSTVFLEDDTHVLTKGLSPGGGGGDFVGIMSAGDTLSPEALYEFVRAIVDRDPPPDVIYCDEDRLASDGRTRIGPILKPSWSPEMLLSYHYTGRLTLARWTLVTEVGGFDLSLDEAAEWDMMLRLSEQTDRVARIPRCLYHNAGNPSTSIKYRGPKHRLVLESHLVRRGLKGAQAAQQPNGTFRVTWPLPNRPPVSVIIPTRDNPDLIRRCLEGLIEKTNYPTKEIILVDNGSTDPDTLSLYDRWASSGVLSIVPFNRPFNYSMACNLGAAAAHGEYLLFLNNDIEVIHPDWLEELVRWGQLSGIGIIGTKLLYPNGTIQHAGRFLPMDMASIFAGEPDDVETIPTDAVFGTPNVYRNVSVLLGACQFVKRPLFDEIGGFDDRSLICSSDDIICLEAQRRGFRNVYTPYAALIHHESVTRGRDDPGVGEDRVLLAQVLDGLGYQEDPFLHPELDPRWLTPALRPEWVPTSRECLRQRIEGLTVLLPKHDTSLHHTRPSLQAFLDGLTHHPIGAHWSVERVGRDIEAATWFVIDVLRHDEAPARQYPRALSDGLDGDFCGWLCSEGIGRYGLHAEASATIRAAFASHPGDPVRRLIEDLGAESGNFRVARVPSLLTGLLSWLVEHKKEYGISDRHIWWFLLESLEDPVRELLQVYGTNPDWQKFFPDALSPPGWERLTHWIRDRYGFDASAYDFQWHTPLSPFKQALPPCRNQRPVQRSHSP